MSNTLDKAIREFEILEKTVDSPIILPFKDEILALVDKFGESGQSGGSAPYTSGAISQAVKKLCMQEPICEITGEDEEWNDCGEYGDEDTYQNNRCGAIFKKGIKGRAYYIDAIVWKGEEDYDTYLGSVEGISSRQYIKFPFKPKKFYIDVIRVYAPLAEIEERGLDYYNDSYKDKDGNKVESYYYTVIKDKSQLEEVWKYYDKE
jgi:hypothetical protein